MSSKGTLTLELLGTDGKGIDDFVSIRVASTQGSPTYRDDRHVGRRIILREIGTGTTATYKIEITPANYRPVAFFLSIPPGKSTTRKVIHPVIPKKVLTVKAPHFEDLSSQLRQILKNSKLPPHGNNTGKKLYNLIRVVPKAALLNIAAKAVATPLEDGRSCLDHFKTLVLLKRDRLFALTTAAFLEEVDSADDAFEKVSGALHTPPAGFEHFEAVESFKTEDNYGNLQLTFFRSASEPARFLVDADIDEAQGVAHVFEVMRNHMTGHKTHPYDIREVLRIHQCIDPGYSFVFRTKDA